MTETGAGVGVLCNPVLGIFISIKEVGAELVATEDTGNEFFDALKNALPLSPQFILALNGIVFAANVGIMYRFLGGCWKDATNTYETLIGEVSVYSFLFFHSLRPNFFFNFFAWHLFGGWGEPASPPGEDPKVFSVMKLTNSNFVFNETYTHQGQNK